VSPASRSTGVSARSAHRSVPFAHDLADHGGRVALVQGNRTITYSDLAAQVARRRAELPDPASGRRLIAVELAPTIEAITTYLAALAAGHPVVVLGPGASSAEVLDLYRPDVVAASDGTLTITDPVGGDGTEPVLHPDLAVLLSTSGSTGSPKLVRLSHDNVQSNAEAIASSLCLRDDDRGVTSLPLHYTYGLSVLHSHLAVGAAVMLTELSVVDACFWRLVDEQRVTSIAAVPFTFELLGRSGFAERTTPSLRRITQAGGRLDPDSVVRWAQVGALQGWDLVVMYGQTEATARMTVLPPEMVADHPRSVGRPIPGGAVRIDTTVGDDPGVGELVYSGPNVMLGYAESVSDLARGREITELRTGDLARVSPEGLVEIVGRLSDVVKPFGLRIDLRRVEDVLRGDGHDVVVAGDDTGVAVGVVRRSSRALDGFTEAAVPGQVNGHVAAIEVDLAAEAQEVENVRRAVVRLTHLPAGAVSVATLDDVPRLPTDKVDRSAVLRSVRDAVSSETTVSPAFGTAGSDVRAVLADVLGVATVYGHDTFVGLGGDSLSYVEVSIRLETVIGSVPQGWHLMSVEELERRAERRSSQPRRGVEMDTTVVLRAVAICLVVGHHTELIGFRGGAHTMLVLAGYNLARFRLTGDSPDRQRFMWRSIAAIAGVSVAWMMVQSIYWDHGWKNFVLLHNYLGDPPMGPSWRYWYIEVVIQTLVVVAVLMSSRRVREFEQRHRYGVALGLMAVALAGRYGVGAPQGHYAIFTTHTVVWLFALGWLIERSSTTRQRVLASAIALATVPGFFGEWSRELVVVLGVLALAWLPTVRVPRRLTRPLGLLAGASLAIYLTHWQVYHPLRPEVPAWIVAPLCLAVGIGAWLVTRHITRRIRFL
jgi:acyl-CoA synthetase (AMP-forming)/AMP-acid ligase II/peptidoglycan/LPS O-acetylase OafA/YrhL